MEYAVIRAQQYLVSIHTPTKGVMFGSHKAQKASYVSIHTPTKGVINRANQANAKNSVSIHTPTKGVISRLVPPSLA